ncbi:unnamed protein product, partial [Allacma fusca]
IKTETNDIFSAQNQNAESEDDEDYSPDDALSTASSTAEVQEPSKEIREEPNCEICGKYFQTTSSLNRHRNTHSIKKPFTCSKCSKSFNRKCSLKDHELTHEDKKPFPCDLCKLSYISKRKLEIHVVKFHVADKPFKCKICLKKFMSIEDLQDHKEKEHEAKKIPCFGCDVCPKTFTKTPLLIKHLRAKHSRLFRCEVCRKSFCTQEEVKGHLEFIPEALACMFCSISLATKCLLTQHLSKLH